MIDTMELTVELIQFSVFVYALGMLYAYSRFLNTETRLMALIFASLWPFLIPIILGLAVGRVAGWVVGKLVDLANGFIR